MQIQDKHRQRRTVILLCIVCVVLQLAFAHAIGLGNGHPNFMFVFAACVALIQGGTTGVVCGYAAGLFFDLTTTGPLGLMSLLLTICSFILGMNVRNVFVDDPRVALVEGALAALGVNLIYSIAMLIAGDASSIVDVVFFRALPTAVLTFVAYLPFAFFFSRSGRNKTGLGSSIGKPLGSYHGGGGL